jgi:hypothetical protein
MVLSSEFWVSPLSLWGRGQGWGPPPRPPNGGLAYNNYLL